MTFDIIVDNTEHCFVSSIITEYIREGVRSLQELWSNFFVVNNLTIKYDFVQTNSLCIKIYLKL